MVWVLAIGVAGAAAGAATGFVWGAGIPAERAGEAAALMGKIGAVAGGVLAMLAVLAVQAAQASHASE
jgi:hypothetical protein